MIRPKLLDTFCKAGGATKGYQRAGWYVVGVDNEPQPRYCGDEFYQADAFEFVVAHGQEFDAIHASPPCQAYANVTRWRGSPNDHPQLIEPTRELLSTTGRPWIIENVKTTALRDPVMICGSMVGLLIIRHRYFETNFPLQFRLALCEHNGCLPFMHKSERAYANAMGCTWMNKTEARQAIPPAYTQWVGKQLKAQLRRRTA